MDLSELAKQGILGLLLAMSLALNGILGKMVLYEKDKRIATAEQVRDELVEPLRSIKESLNLILEKIEISKGIRK